MTTPVALVVEPDASTQLLYADYLTLHAWEVVLAGSGPEALAKAISNRVDVVVSETRLPGFQGTTLCELLHRDSGTCHIPFVFVTADATPANLTSAEQSGASLVFAKPCLPQDLLRALEDLLGRAARVQRRSAELKARASRELVKAAQIVEASKRRMTLKKAHLRGETMTPPTAPPTLRCPLCDANLRYLRSHVGGVSIKDPEQWDYFECGACGPFEYRARTRKLRKVVQISA